MDKKEKIITAIFLVAIFAATVMFLRAWNPSYPRPADVTQAEADFIVKELRRRAAGDCVLTQTETGYVCREFRTGKVFRIAAERK